MISSLIDRLALPELSPADEVFARTYYLVSAFSDTGQTVAKLARSIFLSGLSLTAAPETKWIRHASRFSWNDTIFSFQLTAYSILGIAAPRQAWLKKCNAHISNTLNTLGSSAVGMTEYDSLSQLVEECDEAPKTKLFKTALISLTGETAIRLGLSFLRFMAAYAMTSKEEKETPFMKVLYNGAEASSKLASCEFEALKDLLSAPSKTATL